MIATNIPGGDAVDAKISAARGYIEQGWPVFVLGYKKTPIKNCPRCDTQSPSTYVFHHAEACECLTCHGFYAATLDINRFAQMLERRVDGMLALRMGGESRLIAIDAEAKADERANDDLTGLDVLDDWVNWTNHELTPTLRQRTGSGGLHLVYRLPRGVHIGCHNRVLPQVDIKADMGYIAVWSGDVDGDNRHWLNPYTAVADVPPGLLEWLESKSGKSYKQGGGSRGELLRQEDYEAALTNGVTAGYREPFFAMLSFNLFRQGHPKRIVAQIMHEHWLRCEQPPGDEFPWQAIEYKINRDALGVKADAQVSAELKNWAASQVEKKPDQTQYRKVGKVTLAPRRAR